MYKKESGNQKEEECRSYDRKMTLFKRVCKDILKYSMAVTITAVYYIKLRYFDFHVNRDIKKRN